MRRNDVRVGPLMILALLFLGLLPVMFLPDAFASPDDDSAGNGLGDDNVLLPDTDDDDPVTGEHIPIDEVLTPNDDDDTPVVGEPVNPDDVLQPVEDDPIPPAAADTVLQTLLSEDSLAAALPPLDDGLDGGLDGGPDDPDTATDLADTTLTTPPEGATGDGPAGTADPPEEAADNADTFWLFHDTASGAQFAEIDDFDPGKDFLHISLDPDMPLDGADIAVSPSDSGEDGVVTVNGQVIAILRGAPTATIADVQIDTL